MASTGSGSSTRPSRRDSRVTRRLRWADCARGICARLSGRGTGMIVHVHVPYACASARCVGSACVLCFVCVRCAHAMSMSMSMSMCLRVCVARMGTTTGEHGDEIGASWIVDRLVRRACATGCCAASSLLGADTQHGGVARTVIFTRSSLDPRTRAHSGTACSCTVITDAVAHGPPPHTSTTIHTDVRAHTIRHRIYGVHGTLKGRSFFCSL